MNLAATDVARFLCWGQLWQPQLYWEPNTSRTTGGRRSLWRGAVGTQPNTSLAFVAAAAVAWRTTAGNLFTLVLTFYLGNV
jgi:hypothetical protein